MQDVSWALGRWTHEPVSAVVDGDALVVEAVEHSDAWRVTSYGFIHDSEHALVVPFGREQAVEVSFVVDYAEQFDQAGVFLCADDGHWIKAGVEFADGFPQVGAVVTWPMSDWSVAPVPEWHGTTVTVRASRSGDAVTIRAKGGDDDWRLVRVVPVPEDAELEAGPLVCAPSRAGLKVRLVSWQVGEPDASLH